MMEKLDNHNNHNSTNLWEEEALGDSGKNGEL